MEYGHKVLGLCQCGPPVSDVSVDQAEMCACHGLVTVSFDYRSTIRSPRDLIGISSRELLVEPIDLTP